MAFLSKYRNLRGMHDKGMREVEYNFGRIFHQLGKSSVSLSFLPTNHFLAPGLYSHAVKHYERVLDLADKAGVSCEHDPRRCTTDFQPNRTIFLLARQLTISPLFLSSQEPQPSLMVCIDGGSPYEVYKGNIISSVTLTSAPWSSQT
jgi:hypothetical protein